MTHLIRSFFAVTVLAVGLSACGSSGSNGGSPAPVVPPVMTPPPVEAQFGACFATRYEAAPFTKATDPVPCPDLAPLSLTTKPAVL